MIKANKRPKNKKLRILFVTTEADPFIRVGGLGTVMHSLPIAMNKLGHDARAMLPLYLKVNDKKKTIKTLVKKIDIPTDNKKEAKHITCGIKKYTGGTEKSKPTTTYFLENSEYYGQRANVHGYGDDPVRWALFCRGVLEFLKVSDWKPDIIMATDWQTGYLVNYLKTSYKKDSVLSQIAVIYSIHNLAYQGPFNHRFVQEMNFDDGHSAIPAFEDTRLNHLNGMRRGIMYADLINTVSTTYAKEILTPEYGEGLQDLLTERKANIYGILNGIDYQTWNPRKDPFIENHFSADRLNKRGMNKLALQEHMGLKIDESAFLMGMVTRMNQQKGFDLIEPIIEPLLQEFNIQLVIVGSGDNRYMDLVKDLQEKYPDKIAVHLQFDSILPHLIYAGADALLMPSRYEPSGLTQMEAMHYGTVPIVRKTGGLADTVEDFDAVTNTGNGFVFEKYDAFSLLMAIVRAYENFQHQDSWRKIQQRGMRQDCSWENSAQQYEKMILKAIQSHDLKRRLAN